MIYTYFGKVFGCSGRNPLEKPSATPKLVKLNPPKSATPIVKNGVIEEPVSAPP
jgi:hypothetical protein